MCLASAQTPMGTQGCKEQPSRRRRETRRQVTTATPAGLDFRAVGAADEGFVNAMSTRKRLQYEQPRGCVGCNARFAMRNRR